MRKLAIPAVVLTGIALCAPSGASAQGIQIGPGGVHIDPGIRRGIDRRTLDTRDAVRIARRYGIAQVERVTRSGNRLRVEGVDRRGRDMQVVLHSRTGEVLGVSRGRF